MRKFFATSLILLPMLFLGFLHASAQDAPITSSTSSNEGATTVETESDSGTEEPTEAEAFPEGNSGSNSEGFGVGVPLPGGEEGAIETQNFSNYKDWIETFYTFAVRLGGILTVLMLIYAGYRYMTSQGNPSGINEAKDILIGSLSGYALLLLVSLILKFIGVPQ